MLTVEKELDELVSKDEDIMADYFADATFGRQG